MSHPSVLKPCELQILPEASRRKFSTALGLAPALCGKLDQSQLGAVTAVPAAAAAAAAVPMPTAGPAINPKRKVSLAAKANPDDRPARRRRPTTQTRGAPAPAPARAVILAPAPDPDPDPESDIEEIQVSDSIKYINVQIGCERAVTDAITARLQLLQQLACKIVAKAWIKKIQPKKQTTHPYCHGFAKAPPWWPPKVTHKEPDHIKKAGAWDAFPFFKEILVCWPARCQADDQPVIKSMLICSHLIERMMLLTWLLRVGVVEIGELEEATNELSQPLIAERRGLLKEIYRLARQEWSFRRGEIGGFSPPPPPPPPPLDPYVLLVTFMIPVVAVPSCCRNKPRDREMSSVLACHLCSRLLLAPNRC